MTQKLDLFVGTLLHLTFIFFYMLVFGFTFTSGFFEGFSARECALVASQSCCVPWCFWLWLLKYFDWLTLPPSLGMQCCLPFHSFSLRPSATFSK